MVENSFRKGTVTTLDAILKILENKLFHRLLRLLINLQADSVNLNEIYPTTIILIICYVIMEKTNNRKNNTNRYHPYKKVDKRV